MQPIPRRYRLLLIAAAVACVEATALPAQEPVIPLDTVHVQVASRAGGSLGASTRTVEIITAEAIRRLPASTIGDVLQWAAGVDLMPRSPALADVAIRGSSFEQVLVLIDGVRVTDAQTGHFNLNVTVPLDQVERLEILRGGGSGLHGADAMGGVINIVTRRGDDALTVRADAGSFGTRGVAVSRLATVGGLRVDLGGDLRRSDGHRAGTDYRVGTTRARVHRAFGPQAITADVGFSARDIGADGFYAPFPSYEETRTTTALLAWQLLPGSATGVDVRFSGRRNADDFVLRREEPDFYRNQHSTLQFGGEAIARHRFSPLFRAAAGVEAYRDALASATLGDREERRAAALLELNGGNPGQLTGGAGLRADWHETHGWVGSPSVSGAWWPAPRLRLHASANRSFRTPSWTERYYQDPANVGDPDLKPERAWSAELGAKTHPLPRLAVGVTGFIRNATDLIDWARPLDGPDEPWVTRNLERARFRGLELEAIAYGPLRVRWTAQAHLLSLTASQEAGFTSKYALRPLTETVSLRAEREVVRGFGFAVRGQHARRRGEEAYRHLDLRVTQAFGEVRVHVDLRNLNDAEYSDITGARAAGRAVLVGLEWKSRGFGS